MILVSLLVSCTTGQTNQIRGNDDFNQITVTHENGNKITEFRNKGRIYKVEVTPKHGKSYFIYPDQLNQQKSLNQDLYESGGEGVNWIIKEF